MKHASILVLALTLFVAAPRPSSAADREHQQMVADIRMLQEQAQQLALAVGALGDTLKAVATRLEQQADMVRKLFADQKLLIDNMGADLRVIRERSDETNVRISSLDQEIEALRAALPAMSAPPPPPDAAAFDPQATPTAPPAVSAAPAPSIAGLSPRRMYDQAFADYGAGQYSLAIQGWEAFIRTFPTSDLAPQAQFFIGESQQSAGKFAEAITAYNEVIKRYAASASVPDAYYKRGLAQEKAGNLDAARESWQAAIKGYPESDAGRLAKQGLDRLAARKP